MTGNKTIFDAELERAKNSVIDELRIAERIGKNEFNYLLNYVLVTNLVCIQFVGNSCFGKNRGPLPGASLPGIPCFLKKCRSPCQCTCS
jgi:hypothetical protein